MMKSAKKTLILGAGVTGLGAGMVSGCPVFEARQAPGGICSSYYVRPGSSERLLNPPADEEAYRFEIGGGHWIFGGSPEILEFIERTVRVKKYERRSSVYFHKTDKYVPYPLQNNLRFLSEHAREQILKEIACPGGESRTMKDWLVNNFGPTLSGLFFIPFHELYTAGLMSRVAPQDAYKSPVNPEQVRDGARKDTPSVGYNVTFLYPENGLNELAGKMSKKCDVRYGKQAVRIDREKKIVHFQDGDSAEYEKILSTLPLNHCLDMAGLRTDEESSPYTSVLVLNIGATKGPKCPPDHWLYNAGTKARFHRVGFYSNVDSSFLPKTSRLDENRVSIYVERSFLGGCKPAEGEIEEYSRGVIQELREWGFIDEAEVVDPTWIDVAYTWSLPDSNWREKGIAALHEHGIESIGRYGQWKFQGIADSIQEGIRAGNRVRA